MNEFVFRVMIMLVLCTATVVLVAPVLTSSRGNNHMTYGIITTNDDTETYTSIRFVGDVMLAREIAEYSNRYSASYPFDGYQLSTDQMALVGNFEGAIAERSDVSVTKELQFVFASTTPKLLAEQGFTHMSLANNHSFDAGTEHFSNTAQLLKEANIESFGHPTTISSSSVTYIELGDLTVAIVGLHVLYEKPSFKELDGLFQEVNKESDLQVVFIQWGEEYQMRHNDAQEQLADTLVQLGTDLIVGHHPHVVQDIQLVRGVPVFYSIGNYIFDQYFSESVQQGLVLTLREAHAGLAVELQPVSTVGSRNQPRAMTGYEQSNFLAALAKQSDTQLNFSIQQGIVELPFSVASLREEVMMAE